MGPRNGRNNIRLRLEPLEDRMAPSAVVVAMGAPPAPPTAPCATPAAAHLANVHANVLPATSPAHEHVPCG